MFKRKRYGWALCVFISQLLTFLTGWIQPIHTHSDYFAEARKAKTSEQAIFHTQKACDLAIEENQFMTACEYRLQMGLTFYKASRYLPGIQQIQRGLALSQQFAVHNDTLTFRYYNLLGSMYSRLTMNDSASYWYSQSEQLLRTKPDLKKRIPSFVDTYYYNAGFFWMRLGDYERAENYIRQSVTMAKATGDKASVALSYLQLANYYFLIYQYAEAAVYYRKAYADFNPKSVNACWAMALLGNCLRAEGNLKQGLNWLRTSQSVYTRLITRTPAQRDTDFEFETSYYLGRCEQLNGLDTDAVRSYRACINVYRQFYGNRGDLIAASWSGLAAIAQKQNQLPNALKLVQQALLASTILFSETDTRQNPASDDIKAGKALYEALRLKGLVWLQLYKQHDNQQALEQAIQAFRISLHVAQRIRRSFSQLELTYFFNEKIHPGVADALEAVFEKRASSQRLQQKEMVFDLLQSYQAMSMTDALHEKAIKKKLIPAQMLQQEHDLRQRLAATETQLLDEKKADNKLNIVRQIIETKQKLYDFESALAHDYPRYFALKYDPPTLNIQQLQQRLGKQTAYLSYFLNNQFLYCFFATADKLVVFRRIVDPTFGQLIKTFRETLEQNPGMFAYEGRAASNQLFEHLIGPVEEQLSGIRRLVIERDDILNTIPFDVLEPAEHPDDYLCKRFAISYSYSARLTFATHLPNVPLKAIGFAPYSDVAFGQQPVRLNARTLRESATEMQETGGLTYLNYQATKAQFLRAIPGTNLLHLATHATANDRQPEASSIHFSPSHTDSLLRALEIANLPLDSVRLVVLSACEGNTGILRKAEGLLSLARAFRLAGCPTILTTTWSAHNETTAELMRLFYMQLRRGEPADLALQQARLAFFQSPSFQKWGHPFYWANFTIIGTPNVAFSRTYSWDYWLILFLVVTVFSIGSIFLFQRLAAKPVP